MGKRSVYDRIISELFARKFETGMTEILFERAELVSLATELKIPIPKNLGDVLYSYRYRKSLPEPIAKATPQGMSWIIVGAGRSKYRLILGEWPDIRPQSGMEEIKIYDSTPEIIRKYAKGDEQAVLARVRYNRLIDVFLGITSYSLQNHLRTTVKELGQIEVDELYVGVNQTGTQFVVPVQAKVGGESHSVVQTLQDAAYCEESYPKLVRRCVSAHFKADRETIVMFELSVSGHEVKLRNERHYRLVDADGIEDEELMRYRNSV